MNELLPKDLLEYARIFDKEEAAYAIKQILGKGRQNKKLLWPWQKKAIPTEPQIVLGTLSCTCSMSVYMHNNDPHPINVLNGDSIQYSGPEGTHLNICIHDSKVSQ